MIKPGVCANPIQHRPRTHAVDGAHHPPKAWQAQLLADDSTTDQSWWRIVILCPSEHRDYHDLLDAHVRTGGIPPWSVRRTYSPYIRALVAEAWASRPAKVVYTAVAAEKTPSPG